MFKNNNLETTVYFSKIRENAIIPSKREEDAGHDIYACFDEDYKIIKPHTTILIPTGLASVFSSDYVAILKERGSNGSLGIAQRAGVVDSGYRGEWFVPLTNTTNHDVVIVKKDISIDIFDKTSIIYPYEKAICQAVIIPLPKVKIEEITYDELKKIKSERGIGIRGSSNK